MYCDRQPQHEGGITGTAGGRKSRWRMRKWWRSSGGAATGQGGGSASFSHYAKWDTRVTTRRSKRKNWKPMLKYLTVLFTIDGRTTAYTK